MYDQQIADAEHHLLRVSEAARSFMDCADWYRRCLEDVHDRRVVRGLGEAKAGYDNALRRLASALED